MCVLNLIRETKQNLINEWENDILEWTCLEEKKLKKEMVVKSCGMDK